MELGILDVWRELHPLEKDYTFHSAPRVVHTRFDYFFMTTVDRLRVVDCKIGAADLSDHCAPYLTLNLNRKKKNTAWRMNVSMLNDTGLTEELKKDITPYKELNDNGEVDSTILWDAMSSDAWEVNISNRISKKQIDN